MSTISLIVSALIIGIIIYGVYKTQSEDTESSIVRAEDIPEVPEKKETSDKKRVTKQVKSDTTPKKSSPHSPKKTTTKK
jgi:hypothetical protein